jgi:hypothetical protein
MCRRRRARSPRPGSRSSSTSSRPCYLDPIPQGLGP